VGRGCVREPARRDQHAEDSRRAILAAARHAFARHGYADTALEAIVGPARLTKGALYHHFKNKAAVLEAVYIEMKEELAARMRAASLAVTTGAWERMLAAIDALLAASVEPDYRRIVLCDAPGVIGSARGHELDHAIVLGVVAELVGALAAEGTLVRVTIAATARVVLAAAGEVAVMISHAAEPQVARAEGRAVMLALLDGLRAAQAAPGGRGTTEAVRTDV